MTFLNLNDGKFSLNQKTLTGFKKRQAPFIKINCRVSCFTHLITKEVKSAKIRPTNLIAWVNFSICISKQCGGFEVYLAMSPLATLDFSLQSFILFRQCHANNILVTCGGTIFRATLHCWNLSQRIELTQIFLLLSKRILCPHHWTNKVSPVKRQTFCC